MRFRLKIAQLYSDEFYAHYGELCSPGRNLLGLGEKKEYFAKYNERSERMILDKRLDPAIADFCYQPDCDGKISYGTCKEILNVIGDYDDRSVYGYSGSENPVQFADIKNLLQECVDNRCGLHWN